MHEYEHKQARTSAHQFIIIVMYLYVLTLYRFSYFEKSASTFQSPLSIYCSLHLWNLAVVMFVRARFWLARCAESAYLQWLVVLCFHMMYPAESYVETTHSPKQCCVLWAKGDKTHPDNKRQQATVIIPLLLHVSFHCNYPLKSSQKAPPPRRERGTSAFSRVFFCVIDLVQCIPRRV